MPQFWTTEAVLRQGGLSRWQVEQAVRAGTLQHVRRGWYADPGVDADVFAALRAGYRVGCLSAARLHGLWTPPDSRRHWVLAPGARGGRVPQGVDVHRGPVDVDREVQSLTDCLRQVVRSHDPETALIVLESAANREAIPRSDLLAILAGAPIRSRNTLKFFSERSESGTETRVRLFYERRGVRVRSQVQIPGIGRVDLLVGRSHIVECDSTAHHTGEKNYARDRDRDLAASDLDFTGTRLTWEQVFLTWDTTRASLSHELSRRTHHRPSAVDDLLFLPEVRTEDWWIT